MNPVFEAKIKEEYYGVLEKYCTVLALEELTTVHKKVYKRLSDNNDLFVKDSLEGQQPSDNKAKWNNIFE